MKAYVLADPPVAFVAHPTERGRWLRSAPCVVFVPCPACKSPSGFPCTSDQGRYVATPHIDRREEFKRFKRRLDVERLHAVTVQREQWEVLAKLWKDTSS